MRRSPVVLVLVAFLALGSACLLDDSDPPRPSGDGSGSSSTYNEMGVCVTTCAMVYCGSYACTERCEPGSGCMTTRLDTGTTNNCFGKPCGSGFCHYGSGCFCGGQLCISSGCPKGTGCI